MACFNATVLNMSIQLYGAQNITRKFLWFVKLDLNSVTGFFFRENAIGLHSNDINISPLILFTENIYLIFKHILIN